MWCCHRRYGPCIPISLLPLQKTRYQSFVNDTCTRSIISLTHKFNLIVYIYQLNRHLQLHSCSHAYQVKLVTRNLIIYLWLVGWAWSRIPHGMCHSKLCLRRRRCLRRRWSWGMKGRLPRKQGRSRKLLPFLLCSFFIGLWKLVKRSKFIGRECWYFLSHGSYSGFLF